MNTVTRGEFLSGLGAAGFLAAIGVGSAYFGRRVAVSRKRLDGFRSSPMKKIRVFVAGEGPAAAAAAIRLGKFIGVTVVAAEADADVVYNLTTGNERARVIASALAGGRHVVSPDGIGTYPGECLKQILLAEGKRLHLTSLPSAFFDASVAFFEDSAKLSEGIDAVEMRKTFLPCSSRYPGDELAPVFKLLGVGVCDTVGKLVAFEDKGGGCATVFSLESGRTVTILCERGEKAACKVTLRGAFGRRDFDWDPAGVDEAARDRAWISALQEGRPMPISAYEAARVAVVADQAEWSANNDSVRLDFPRF